MKKKQFTYQGIDYDSQEEVMFAHYCEELKANGYIKSWRKNEAEYKLTSGLYVDYQEEKVLKTKTTLLSKRQTLLNPSVYTPDFEVLWDNKALGLFFNPFPSKIKITCPFLAQKLESEDYFSLIETKGKFDRDNMIRLFKNNQKFMWDKLHIYVNLIIPQTLFEKTFTPQEYLKTPTGKKRKITKWKVSPISEYLNK